MANVFFFGDGKAEGDPKRRDLLGGKGAGLAEMTSLGLPVPPGFTISTEVVQRASPRRSEHPGRRREGGRTRRCARREERRREARRPREPAARQRPLRRARVDARHDGHDPEPRPERRDRRGAREADGEPRASPTTRTAASSRCTRASRSASKSEPFDHALDEARAQVATREGRRLTRLNAEELKRKVPDSRSAGRGAARRSSRPSRRSSRRRRARTSRRPEGAALGRDRGGLRVVEQPPRDRLPPDARHPRRLGHGVQRAGDGLRQPRRRLAPPASRSRATRRRARSSSTASGCRTRRARTSSRASARRMPIRATAGESDDSLEAKMPAAYARARRHLREAREALPRHAGPRVHHPERQALHAPVPQRRSAPARAAVRIAVEMVKEGLITKEEAVLRVEPGVARPAPAPDARSERAEEAPRARPRRRARARRAGTIVFSADEAERRAGAGQAGHPGAHRDLAGGHPRHEGGARHPHGARRHDEPRGRRRARDGQAVRRGLLGACT